MRNALSHLRNRLLAPFVVSLALTLAGCNDQETAAVGQTFGSKPTLVEPEKSLIPTVNVAKAIGWPAGVSWALALAPLDRISWHDKQLCVSP